jgi:hypothetical protein
VVSWKASKEQIGRMRVLLYREQSCVKLRLKNPRSKIKIKTLSQQSTVVLGIGLVLRQ